MNRAPLISVFFTICISFAICKLEAQSAGSKIWYFGINAGVDFTTSPPSALTNGQVNTDEGCAAVSDQNGKLFFYTDGRTVYNASHVQMSNGTSLNGDPSSTQSAVAVGDPGNNYRYYLFTVDAFAGPKGLSYSIIDMSKMGGLGQVTTKNIPLRSPVSEKITAIRRANSTGVWVITRGWNNDSFHVFLLDSFGCKFFRSQAIGTVITGGTANSAGYLKSNIQGTKIAYATYQGFIEIFDFDAVTARFSNTIKVSGLGNVYGIEFSKSGSLIYFGSSTTKRIWQMDLSLSPVSAILASQTTVANISGNAAYALQMGPDEKIYMAIPSSDYLSCIPNPETKGTGCGYIQKAIDLKGKLSRAGLPNALNSDNFLPYTYFNYTANCAGKSVQFSDTMDYKHDSLRWYFGVKGNTYLGTSNSKNPSYTFPKSDTFDVKLVAYIKTVRVDSVTRKVVVPKPILNLKYHSICQGDSIFLSGKFRKLAGIYSDTLVSYLKCDSVIQHHLEIRISTYASINITNCPERVYDFYGTQVKNSGTYLHKLKNHLGCDSIITLNYNTFPVAGYQFSDSICFGKTYDFYGQPINTTGVYTKKLASYRGCDSTVTLSLKRLAQNLTLVSDTFCLNDTYNFYGRQINRPGNYSHTISSPGKCDSFINLKLNLRLCYPVVPCILEFPGAFTPDGNGINDEFKPVISCNILEYQLSIYNRWGQQVFKSDNPSVGWNGKFLSETVPDGMYVFRCDITAQQSLDPEKHHFDGAFMLMK